MMLVLTDVFWISISAVTLSYAGYPLVLLLLRPFSRKARIDNSFEPQVSLVISAFNEAAVIREKIENALSLDYPPGRLEVVVISDNSDDGTDDIVRDYLDQGVRLCRQVPRRGKSMGLTRFVPELKSEIVVFSDANSIYQPDAIRRLVRHFADGRVGFSVGHQRYYADGTDVAKSESLYWRYETFLKVEESRFGSVVCGDGAIYAIRRDLFEPLRADDINDFYLPLRIVARGYRGIFDREAICYERTAADFAGEFRRKVRIVNRSLRAVTRVPQALNPFKVGFFAFQLAVHKVLRWFVPFFLIAALITNVVLAAQGLPLYQVLLALQVSFYGLALLRPVPVIGSLKPVYIAAYFCLMNSAAFLGVIGCALGTKFTTWQPERTEPQFSPLEIGAEHGTRAV